MSWNSGAERLYGYTAAETLGRNASVLSNPGEAPHFSNALALLTRGLIPERTADGSLVDVSLSFSPVRDADGNMIGVSCIARDITAWKKIEADLAESHMVPAGSQARLAEAQRLAHVGNWEYDIETDRNTWSDEIFRLFEIPLNFSMGAALLPIDSMRHDAGRAEALRLAEERLRRAKSGADGETEADRIRAHAERSLDGFSMRDASVTAVDNKDRYTRRHSEDVLTYSLMIARELGLSEAEQHTVAIAALLHDVGKIGIPDSVLRNPGRRTDEEFEAIKPHPVMGAALVSTVPGLEDTLDAVRHHHGRWDGRGYPYGLCGVETPLIARLMAVAGAFSAMTTDRPYRRGMAHADALTILEAGGGTQWDTRCVTAFLEAMGNSTGKIPDTARDALAA